MARPKKGTKGHVLALAKYRRSMLEKYGSKEAVRAHYQEIGRQGGKVLTPGGGFGQSHERAVEAGRKGGRVGGKIGKRGYKSHKAEDGTITYTKIVKSIDENQ